MPSEPLPTPAPIASPSPAVESDTKVGTGISIARSKWKTIDEWLEHICNTRRAGVRFTRGTVIEEMVDTLQAAGWRPGDLVRVPKSRR